MKSFPIAGVAAAALTMTVLVTAQPASAAGTTTVTLQVQGCDGCTIGIVRALSADGNVTPKKPRYWDGGSATVVGGKVVFTVPTAYTPGISFTISAPWEGDTGAVSNIVLGDGSAAGKTLTTMQAKARKKATACWAGTSGPKATIRVSVAKATVQGYGGPAVAALAWATPSVPTVGPLNSTYKGTLGNQDAYYC